LNQNEITNILFEGLKSTVDTPNALFQTNGLQIITIYPNPLTNSAKVQISTNGEHITLKLYSLSGQAVKTLTNSRIPKGNQFVSFSRKGIANGHYILVQQSSYQKASQPVSIQ
jgi:hypothetical protein